MSSLPIDTTKITPLEDPRLITLLTKVFNKLDTNHSGFVTVDELHSLMTTGWHDEPVDKELVYTLTRMFNFEVKPRPRIVQGKDEEHFMRLNLEEFIRFWVNLGQMYTKFENYGNKSKKNMNKEQLAEVLHSYGHVLEPKVVDAMMKRFARADDHRIYFDDFVRILYSLRHLTFEFFGHFLDDDDQISLTFERALKYIFEAHL